MFQKSSVVGDRIRAERKRAGLSQDQLAERLHVTRQTISNWEGGKSQPDIESLKSLAEALDVPIERLIYDQPPERSGASGGMVPTLADWCRWLGVFVLALALIQGVSAGSGAVQAADGGVWWDFSWRESFPVWYEGIIRSTIFLGISHILTLLQDKGP